MNSHHIIRIRGPWQRTVVDGGVDDSDLCRTVQMPSSWSTDLGAEFLGRVQYKRFFNKPSNTDATTPIRLFFEQVIGHATVALNAAELGHVDWPSCSVGFDLTGKLQPRNELIVDMTALTRSEVAALQSAAEELPPAGLVGEVQLQIG